MARDNLPAILEVQPLDPSWHLSCNCFCHVRHGDAMGVCLGNLAKGGYKVRFNSVFDIGAGVQMCRPCLRAFPEFGTLDVKISGPRLLDRLRRWWGR
jgi:hypothetical protein